MQMQRQEDKEEGRRRAEEERRRFDALLARLTPQAPVEQVTGNNPSASQAPQVMSKPLLPKATPPPALSQDVTLLQFKEWHQQWEDYAVMVELDSLPQPMQLAQLRGSLSTEMRRVLEVSLGVATSSTLTVSEVIPLLRDFVRGQRNEALRRLAFSQCKQEEGEKFTDFYVRLKQVADEVDLCKGHDAACVETQMKHAVLIGIRDEETKHRLLELQSNATLDQVNTVCRSREAAEATTQELRPHQPTARAVSSYKKQKKQNNTQGNKRQNSGQGKKTANRDSETSSELCGRCGYKKHEDKKCPAKEEKCRKCGKVGHFEKCCRTKEKGNTTQEKSGNVWSVSCHRNASVCASTVESNSVIGPPSPTIRLHVQVNGKSGHVICVPDTGAETTVMSKDVAKQLGLTPKDLRHPETFGLNNPDGTEMTCTLLGSVYADMTYGEVTIQGWINILDKLPKVLLSWKHSQELRIVPKDYPKQMAESGNLASVTSSRACTNEQPPPLQSAQTNKLIENGSRSADSRRDPQSAHTNELIENGVPSAGSRRDTHPPPHPTPRHPSPTLSPEDAKKFFLREFPDVLMTKEDIHQGTALKEICGPPMRIYLKDNAKPYAVYTPRMIPLAWQSLVKDELDAMVDQGIIVPAGDEPSEWCHPLVTVAKPNGAVRLTVDLTKLNPQVLRPVHPSPTPHAAVRRVGPGTRYYTTMDALYGYWQVPLAEEDQHLTTFITPYGRYRFCRGPMGFVATGDEFCRRGDVALEGIEHCTKVVDDILLWDMDYKTHLERVYEVLMRCRAYGITINANKFVLAAPEVSFCGYGLSYEGITADDEKVKAITKFPKPANITDVRSFLGLVNQLGDFSAHIAETAKALRSLMSPRSAFIWTPDHDAAFENVKKTLSKPPVLAHFDPALKVVLQTDASRLYGVGYALLQEHKDGSLRLIQCGSRFLADVESRYSVIELEMVAVVWAMNKCKYYLMGLPHFTVVIDHRPLVPVLNNYTLDAIENPRLQRLKEKIMGYVYTATWRKGKEHAIPDALSRAPVDQPTPEDIALGAETGAYVRGVVTQRTGDRVLEGLRVSSREDPVYTKLLQCVTQGFPKCRDQLDPSLWQYWKERDNLYHDGELVLIGPRVVVPTARRREVLARLHDAHCGVEATKRRARQTVWWPGINSDITNTVQACEPCQVLQPSQQQEPLMLEEAPSLPFESVSADFFSTAGKSYLVYVDRLSGWPVVAQCGDTTTTATITFFRKFFRDMGVPVRLRTDGGPQFASHEFAEFLRRWGVSHEMSSPHYPQSNGHAESAVKAVKHLVLKVAPSGKLNEDFDRGLLELRNTPRQDGRSPAQVLFGRPLRSLVPAHSASFASKWQEKAEESERRAAARVEDVKQRYDSHAKPLPPLHPGDNVRIQDPTSKRWDKVAIVMGQGKSRDYIVRTTTGRVMWRNRRFLRTIPAPKSEVVDEVSPDTLTPVTPSHPSRRRRDNTTHAEPSRRSQRLARRRGEKGDVS